MFTSYRIDAASTNPTDSVISQYANSGFGGVANPGPGRSNSAGFGGGQFNSELHGEVESGHSFSGEPGHNASLSSTNHSLPCDVVLDTAQQAKMEVMIPRGKIGFFLNSDKYANQRIHGRIQARKQLPAVQVVFGGTKLTSVPAAIYCIPVASTVFVPGKTSVTSSKSQYIAFAFGDSTQIELDRVDDAHCRDTDRGHCINPGLKSPKMEAVPPGAPIYCAPRMGSGGTLAATLFCGYCPVDAKLLGILKIPTKSGDTSATIALIR